MLSKICAAQKLKSNQQWTIMSSRNLAIRCS